MWVTYLVFLIGHKCAVKKMQREGESTAAP